jgi:hypothetical protein
MRKTSLVASCCSAACRNSCACAAIVFFSAATESAPDEAPRFAVDFLGVFLAIVQRKTQAGPAQVRANLVHTPGTTGINRSGIPFE